ncbi:alpha/beta hydrolase [Lentibacillus sp. CBA3610]|uniref:alpha/beta hydrolase n=1 Tax=Lentibacillus sp. CBA3610 TaxID=2518176 RepID=UPI001595A5E2|nr:alpha/beta hydrolase [Lentibacillus sp. CBA3610]QKY71093.1 alpha/beta hydrolase [Lentibacillus sp. CBA3610]
MKKTVRILCLVIVILMVAAGCRDGEEGNDETDLNGEWTGSIEIPSQPLDIIVNLNNDDEWNGTISIPVQGLQDYPLSSITVNGTDVAFFMEIQGQQISFDGEYKDETIEGDFTQHGQTFPFNLTKGGRVEESEADLLSVETDEGTLYGELEKPDGEGPFPVMLIIPGSGPTDRDGNSSGIPGNNNSLKLLAEGLAEHGIASVRYDKRGVGNNLEAAIPENELHFNQFVNDAVNWTELLEQEEDYSHVGIIGHSQGALVGMLAAQESNADAFISLAGAGRSIDEVLYGQLEAQLSGDLLDEVDVIMEKLQQGEEVQGVSQELQSVFRPSAQSFMASWMQYDPAEEIAELDMPVLIAGGGRDLQVPSSEAELLHDAKPDSEKILLEKMNHVLKEAPEDEQNNMETYGNSDLPLADGLMDGIMVFLNENEFLE